MVGEIIGKQEYRGYLTGFSCSDSERILSGDCLSCALFSRSTGSDKEQHWG